MGLDEADAVKIAVERRNKSSQVVDFSARLLLQNAASAQKNAEKRMKYAGEMK